MTMGEDPGGIAVGQAAGPALSRPRGAEQGHLAFWQRQADHVPALVAGLLLGLLTLGPGLARGFLLSYDMVFVPTPPFSPALLGITGGPARAVPSNAVMTVLARLLPADVLQKIILLLIFIVACSGGAALLAAGWRQVMGSRPYTLACLAAGVYYAWNPYVAERLLIGQWALLLAYAGLPWVLRELCTGEPKIKPGRLLLCMLPAAVGGFAAMTVTGLATTPVALARGGSWRIRRLATVMLMLFLLSLPWLIPSLIVPVHAAPLGVDLFAARADTPFGRLGSLILLSGIWNDQTVPRGYGGIGSSMWLLVVACALSGYVLCSRARRRQARPMWPGLGMAGLIGLVVAAIGITSPTRAVLRDLVAAWPGFAVLWDGQQFVAALALTEAVGIGAAVAWFLGWVRVRAGKVRAEPAAVALAVLALVAPILLLPGMAWGEFGRLRPVQYPADWLLARHFIDDSPARGSVLLLPWGAYRRYPWNGGEAVYDPWNELLSRQVISDDGLQVGRQTLPPDSAASIRMNRILTTTSGPLTAALRRAGVRYVVIDAGALLGKPAAALAIAARLPGAVPIVTSRDVAVLKLPGES